MKDAFDEWEEFNRGLKIRAKYTAFNETSKSSKSKEDDLASRNFS